MRLVLLFLVTGVLVADTITFGMHSNYDVQLPASNLNTSGVTIEELEKQSPQYAFSFSGDLVGYFGLVDVNPARLVVWTTRRGPDYESPDEFYAAVIPPIPPPFVPPPVPPVIPPPVVPPQENVPEPNTWILVFGGVVTLLGMGSLRRAW